jgi:hypothetical protein
MYAKSIKKSKYIYICVYIYKTSQISDSYLGKKKGDGLDQKAYKEVNMLLIFHFSSQCKVYGVLILIYLSYTL